MIDDFSNDLNSIYSVYINTISELDVTVGASTDPVKKAFEAYRGGGNMLHKKYERKLQSLQREIYKEAPELQLQFGGAQYIRWGQSFCSTPGADISLSGVAVTSPTSQGGGSSDFFCSPLKPELINPEVYFKNYNPKDEGTSRNLRIIPIKYRGSMGRFKSMLGKNFACSQCTILNRTAVMMKMAAKSCPENWVKEYEGYVMAPGRSTTKSGEYICVDEGLKEPDENIEFDGTSEKAQEVTEVAVSCGALPCGPYKSYKSIPCVVCTV